MKTIIDMNHQMVKVASDFDNFTRNLEASLIRLDPATMQKIGTEPAVFEVHLKQMGGEEDLILFDMQNHGQLLTLVDAPKKAKQYVIGNPLIAVQMTQHDIRAALYAPLRLLVYEAADQSVYVEYDLPSSLFGQFGNAKVTKVAESLDLKLVNLIAKVDQ
ncbi:DUF302 domain-containing protein (plasmid) [Nostoc sp. UHCC 0926]|uniref:DUF302 domain-containing protein n=1 Tax=Nostoc sp. UHCC 0926 TaxID=3025190 RepID=UPI00235FE431|nr:DUF302 domain-containing protein [Nostoc sp. UHCC 0926]WDD37010.1 DUF302 domain-containing protein [Nostoc sp. UHCC 0926]